MNKSQEAVSCTNRKKYLHAKSSRKKNQFLGEIKLMNEFNEGKNQRATSFTNKNQHATSSKNNKISMEPASRTESLS